jgi:hypothetical protein
MTLDNFLNDCQAKAAGLKVITWLQWLKDVENPLLKSRRDARTVVGDLKLPRVTISSRGNPNVAGFAIVMPDAIVDQVLEHMPEWYTMCRQNRHGHCQLNQHRNRFAQFSFALLLVGARFGQYLRH